MSDTPDTPISGHLRDLAFSIDDGCSLGDLPLGWTRTLAMLTDAADEIDRLTAALGERDATIAELTDEVDRLIDRQGESGS